MLYCSLFPQCGSLSLVQCLQRLEIRSAFTEETSCVRKAKHPPRGEHIVGSQ